VTRRLVFSPEARTDLRQLYLHIAGQSGDARALAYIGRIEAFCLGLADFPERGTRRDNLYPGMRTIGFERRVTIAFTVTADTVTFLRILYGGRDLEAAFGNDEDD
jgi:toxin ParE1/3/4